jgi:hypothetical protein
MASRKVINKNVTTRPLKLPSDVVFYLFILLQLQPMANPGEV